jgi:hypothetical protein
VGGEIALEAGFELHAYVQIALPEDVDLIPVRTHKVDIVLYVLWNGSRLSHAFIQTDKPISESLIDRF